MSEVVVALEPELSAEAFADILRRSTLADRRPADDLQRLEGMLRSADIVVTARTDTGELVGVSRAISDFHYCTYLSDLAVAESHQRQGIGRALIQRTHEAAGQHTHLVLLAAPAAREYYGKVGMERHDACWMTKGNR